MQYPAEGLWPHGSKSVVQVALPNAPYDMVDREQETVAVSPELGSHLRPIASGLLSAERLTLRYCYFHCIMSLLPPPTNCGGCGCCCDCCCATTVGLYITELPNCCCCFWSGRPLILPRFDDLLRINPPRLLLLLAAGFAVFRPGVSGGDMSPVELPESLLLFCVRSIRLRLFIGYAIPRPGLVPWKFDCCCCC